MIVSSEKDLLGLTRIGQICGATLQEMIAALKPGITTRELDEIGSHALMKHHARSAPILVYKYPGVTCISINDEAAHGIPGDRVVQVGDLVNIDVSAELDGYFADTGASVPVPPISPESQALCDATQAALNAAISAVRAGEPLNVIGRAVEDIARKGGYHIIRELGGHGVGRGLHETPRNVPNFYTTRARERLADGQVLTIEPFLTTGSGKIFTARDGWTLKTSDGAPAAQYEHTLVITPKRPVLITKVV